MKTPILIASRISFLVGAAIAACAQTPAWETAAGGAMSFEVASIHLTESDKFTPPTFPMDTGDAYTETGGRFSADFPLSGYISFAYKLSLTPEQRQAMLAHLPKWVSTDRFSIRAKAASGNPTKDQMRLMVRALLIDRFHVAVHFEAQTVNAYVLELAKPDKLGPNLRPHAEGPPCDKPDANVFPARCNVAALMQKGLQLSGGARNVTLEYIAGALPGMGKLDRPMVDRTGLTGAYDFKLEWVSDPAPAQPGAAPGAVSSADGPSFVQALREQLGLKLESAKVPQRVAVIDRVERPSEN